MKALWTLLLIVVLVSAAAAQPQPPVIEWSRTYGSDSSDSNISGALPTSDGGYMLCGSVLPYGAAVLSDMLLMRTNAVGDCVWSETYGGISYEVCTAMLATTDGGLVLAGYRMSENTVGFDFMLLKMDAQGDCLWSHTYGRDGHDICNAVQPTPDGGYLLAGATDATPFSCGWLVKTDANGDSLWSRLYGGDGHSEFLCVRQTVDQNFVLAGRISYDDLWVMKIDQSGDSLWSRAYGGTGGLEVEGGESVRQTADGGFVVAGWKLQETLEEDFWLVKTDANGDSLWSRAYGGENSRDECYDVMETEDGGYVLIGQTTQTGVWSLDGLVIRTNADGDSLWSLRLGDANRNVFTTGLRTADGGFVFGGTTATDFFSQSWLVKTGPELLAGETPVARSVCLLSNYPNPFNPTTTLSFSLPRTSQVTIRAYDILGREVELIVNTVYPAGAHTVAWTPWKRASGTYLISLTGDGFHMVRKTILLR